jgi:hypothetical protein
MGGRNTPSKRFEIRSAIEVTGSGNANSTGQDLLDDPTADPNGAKKGWFGMVLAAKGRCDSARSDIAHNAAQLMPLWPEIVG